MSNLLINKFCIADEFPIIGKNIYMDHAAVSPWPARVVQSIKRYADERSEEGISGLSKWNDMVESLKHRLALLINANSEDDIAILKNTSEALSFIAFGIPWGDCDNVVIIENEFLSNIIVWESLCEYGVDLKKVSTEHNYPSIEDAIIASFDENTRLLSVSSVQYSTGYSLDLNKLGNECKKRSIAFCVDAIQSLGAEQIDVKSCKIDFLVADAHKWLLAPEGTAIFYCTPEWRYKLKLHEFGWHMVNDAGNFDKKDWEIASTSQRFECGSPNYLGISALNSSLSLFFDIGSEVVYGELASRTQYLLEYLSGKEIINLFTPTCAGKFAGITSFCLRVRPSYTFLLWRYLTERGITCSIRSGRLRLSPHFYTPFEDVVTVTKVIDQFLFEQRNHLAFNKTHQ